jgi:hypothetical protein
MVSKYYRHGTLSLYGALNTQTGDVLAKTSARHTSAEFVDFLAQIVAISRLVAKFTSLPIT